jgi:uncharacterized protein
MLFAVFASDRPGALAERQRVREAHRARLRAPAPHAVRVLLGGPTLGEDGSDEMNGTLLIVEADSLDAVRRFIADDPYVLANVYEQVEIRPWRCGLGLERLADSTS